MPNTQKAIVIQGPGSAKFVKDRPIPNLRADCILVRTVAVALNPSDWKHIEYLVREPGPLVGCDYSGIVEKVGSKVSKNFVKGDRVCGVAHGSNVVQHEDGTFAEFIVVKGDLQIKIPENITFEEAATLGIGITTTGQSLYQSLGLCWPTEPTEQPTTILIYGGSTATGVLGIQFAKLSGYTVLTTCSSRNTELVKSLGADEVFDYTDPRCGEQIRQYTKNTLTLAWDTVALPTSAKICADALSSTIQARYHSLLPIEFPRKDVDTSFKMAYTAFGERFFFGDTEFVADSSDYRFAVKFWEVTRELLEAGKIRAHRFRIDVGLEGILDGLTALKENKVSGEKLAYRLTE